MTSLAKISAAISLDDDSINLITSQSSWIGANKTILDFLILFRGYDREMMEFCSLAESIIGDEQKIAEVVEPLRNGWFNASPSILISVYMHILMCVYVYVHCACI